MFLAHELAHQWFGDAVTPADWSDLWLNESFATYGQWLWLDHVGVESLDVGDVADAGGAPVRRRADGGAERRQPVRLRALRRRRGRASTPCAGRSATTPSSRCCSAGSPRTTARRARPRTSPRSPSEVAGRDLSAFFATWLDAADPAADVPRLIPSEYRAAARVRGAGLARIRVLATARGYSDGTVSGGSGWRGAATRRRRGRGRGGTCRPRRASARAAARRPRLTPSQRNGSGSHGRERWPDPRQVARARCRGPRIRSASVRPARFVVDDAVADVATGHGDAGGAVEAHAPAPVARDAERPAPVERERRRRAAAGTARAPWRRASCGPARRGRSRDRSATRRGTARRGRRTRCGRRPCAGRRRPGGGRRGTSAARRGRRASHCAGVSTSEPTISEYTGATSRWRSAMRRRVGLGRQHDDVGAHRAAARDEPARLDDLDRGVRVQRHARVDDGAGEGVDEAQRVQRRAVRRERPRRACRAGGRRRRARRRPSSGGARPRTRTPALRRSSPWHASALGRAAGVRDGAAAVPAGVVGRGRREATDLVDGGVHRPLGVDGRRPPVRRGVPVQARRQQRRAPAAVAAARAEPDVVTFEDRDAQRRIRRRQRERGPQPGEAAADDRHVDVGVTAERRPVDHAPRPAASPTTVMTSPAHRRHRASPPSRRALRRRYAPRRDRRATAGAPRRCARRGPASPTLPAAGRRAPAGWYPDPFGQVGRRYFDGRGWTAAHGRSRPRRARHRTRRCRSRPRSAPSPC